MQILVVCTGNICRSPMGEAVLGEYLQRGGIENVSVKSAGISAEEQGHGIDPRARQILVQAGYPIPVKHRAHRCTSEELNDSDLILAMTVGHARGLGRMMNEIGADLRKIHLWREFDGTLPLAEQGVFGSNGVLACESETGSARNSGCRRGTQNIWSDNYESSGKYDVPDPWYGDLDGFYETLAVVEAGSAGITKWLKS